MKPWPKNTCAQCSAKVAKAGVSYGKIDGALNPPDEQPLISESLECPYSGYGSALQQA